MKICNGHRCLYPNCDDPCDPCCTLLPRRKCCDPCCNCCYQYCAEICLPVCRTSCYALWPTMPKTPCDPKPACLDDCEPPTCLMRCYSCCPPKKCCPPCPPADPCCCQPPAICCQKAPRCGATKRCCSAPPPREILNYYNRNHLPPEPDDCKGPCCCLDCSPKKSCCPPKPCCPPTPCCEPCCPPYCPPCRKPICYPPVKLCEDKCDVPRERICFTPCSQPRQPTFCTCGMPNPCDCNLIERRRRARCANSPCCRRCGDKVFAAEKIVVGGGSYHTSCFTCYCCHKPLEITTVYENQGEIYCKMCYGKFFGIKGYGFGTTLQSV